MLRHTPAILLRTWLVTGIVDGIFASVLARIYGSTVTRLWQGVAAVPFGADMVDGGTRTALIGVLLHFGVALAWSALFVLLALNWSWLRRTMATHAGVLAVAAIYGPLIWMAMSSVVIPAFTGRPPAITLRWWIQFFAHIPFVAIPIVATTAYGLRSAR